MKPADNYVDKHRLGQSEGFLRSQSVSECIIKLVFRARFSTASYLMQMRAKRRILQAIKDWHKRKPELIKKQPYYVPGCDG